MPQVARQRAAALEGRVAHDRPRAPLRVARRVDGAQLVRQVGRQHRVLVPGGAQLLDDVAVPPRDKLVVRVDLQHVRLAAVHARADVPRVHGADAHLGVHREDAHAARVHAQRLLGLRGARDGRLVARHVALAVLLHDDEAQPLRVRRARQRRSDRLGALEVAVRRDHHEDRRLAANALDVRVEVEAARRLPEAREEQAGPRVLLEIRGVGRRRRGRFSLSRRARGRRAWWRLLQHWLGRRMVSVALRGPAPAFWRRDVCRPARRAVQHHQLALLGPDASQEAGVGEVGEQEPREDRTLHPLAAAAAGAGKAGRGEGGAVAHCFFVRGPTAEVASSKRGRGALREELLHATASQRTRGVGWPLNDAAHASWQHPSVSVRAVAPLDLSAVA